MGRHRLAGRPHPHAQFAALPDYPKPKIGHLPRLGDTHLLQMNLFASGFFEQVTPPPSSTGATCTIISSSSPASRHRRATVAPNNPMFASPAALFAFVTASSIPSVTKVPVIHSGTLLGGSCVSTNSSPCHSP